MAFIEDLIFEIPPITLSMIALSITLTCLTFFEIVTPYTFYFNLNLIVYKF